MIDQQNAEDDQQVHVSKTVAQFVQELRQRDCLEEYRILQRSTLHIDHAKNLVAMQIPDFKS